MTWKHMESQVLGHTEGLPAGGHGSTLVSTASLKPVELLVTAQNGDTMQCSQIEHVW